MHAKIFTSGNSQAVRLPKEIAFPADITEVIIEKTATGGLLLKPFKAFDWDMFFDETEASPLDISIPEDKKADSKRQQVITKKLNIGLE